MDVFGAIFVAIAVIGVTAVLFGGWILVGLMRGLGQAINLLIGGGTVGPSRLAGPTRIAGNVVRCPRARCHADNPAGVQFCRRCGRWLRADQQAPPLRRPSAIL
jgi:hypothetical protein